MTKKPDMNKIADIMAAAERDLTVIPELKELLRPMGLREREELEKNLIAEGVRDPIVVWKEKNAILDGHNRYEIATKLELAFTKKEISLPDIDAAKKWMITNQLGRRNLTPMEYDYLLGLLYNTEKQTETKNDQGGVTTAEKIAKDHGVGERTVRRAGETAKGIDMLAAVKGKLAKAATLAGEGPLTRQELQEVGKASSPAVARRMVEKLEEVKAAGKKAKQVQKTSDEKKTLYRAAFCQPAFGVNFNPVIEPKPALEKEAILFMVTPDEALPDAIKLMERWGLLFEGSIIFHGKADYDGTFSKIVHQFMLIGTKGTVAGPKKGKESKSVIMIAGDDPTEAMFKIAETYVTDGKRIDMRKNANRKGWEKQ